MEEIEPGKPVPLKRWKFIIPVAIGLSVSGYLLYTNFDKEALLSIHLTWGLIGGLALAVLSVIIRDISFVYKLRLSTGNRLTWMKSLQTIIMWEFGAAITPKLSEGAFVLYVLRKSGLSYGRSTAVLMLNSFLDNLVFVMVFTILFFVLGHDRMLELSSDCPDLVNHQVLQGIRHISDKAWIGYGMMVALCAFLANALFIAPHSTKNFFYRLGSWKLLKRFNKTLTHVGDEIENTAAEYKGHPFSFWIKMYIATFVNWTFRYLLQCILFVTFAGWGLSWLDMYARQYLLWIFLIIPATPGSSGLAEIAFMAMNCDFMPVGLGVAITFLWRLYSHYLYVIIGMLIFPKWVADIVKKPTPKSPKGDLP